MNNQTRSAVIFNTGIGDALQLIPLCRALKENGHHVTGIFSSSSQVQEIIGQIGILDRICYLKDSYSMLSFAVHQPLHFDQTLIEHSASSLRGCLFSCIISKKVYTNRIKWYLRFLPNLIIRKPTPNAHLIIQNVHLSFPSISFEKIKTLNSFDLPADLQKKSFVKIEGDYLTVQICAANNTVDYKNWPIENWIVLFRKINHQFPKLKIILIGDKNEVKIGETIMKESINNVCSIIGQTTLTELVHLLQKAKLYLGLDSGSMHLAAMLGTPTLTIWGPTDPVTLGYQVFDSKKHLDISTNLHCHPCLSWIRPNNSLHKHPLQCPHRNCIQKISPDMVFQLFIQHLAQQSATATL